jgi:hypothetical protein
MERALKDTPDMPREMPPGVVVVPTGPFAAGGETRAVPEFFYKEAVPPPEVLRPPVLTPVTPAPPPLDSGATPPAPATPAAPAAPVPVAPAPPPA